MKIDHQDLLIRLGYDFVDSSLLERALTHRSYSADNNERLEFLGDAVLDTLVSQALYERFASAAEGELSQLRSKLVKGEVLAMLATEFDLGDYVRLGAGELRSGGVQRKSILADAMEAIIGAIFLDGGYSACQQAVQPWFTSRLNSLSLDHLNKDAKTNLQEYLQANGRELPVYEIVKKTGEAHKHTFTVRCILPDINCGAEGIAGTRKKAEQIAAKCTLEKLKNSQI